MKKIINTFAACALLAVIVTPASAAIDPALEQEFYDAAIRAIEASNFEASDSKLLEELEAASKPNGNERVFNGEYADVPKN